MPTLHDLMADSVDNLALDLRDAEALPATRGLIAHRRRRIATVAGGTSVLAIGSLVAAGIVQDLRADDSPASADPNAIQYVTMDADAMSGIGRGFVPCGDEVPSPVGENEGFTQAVAVDPDSPSDSPRINASLDYNGHDRAPAFITAGYAVLARDGVVVMNYYAGGGRDDGFASVTSGHTWTANSLVDQAVFQSLPCFSGTFTPPRPDEVAYPAGNYQVFVVSQAVTSSPMVAAQELADRGYYLAEGRSGVWNPGLIDCSQMLEQSGNGGVPVPVQCLDSLPFGVTLDPTPGIATLPYHSVNYSGDLDVTLVSEPINVTLDRAITFGDLGLDSASAPAQLDGPALACGESPSGIGSAIVARLAEPTSFDDIVSGVDCPILIDVNGSGVKSRGTLHMGAGATAALIPGARNGTPWIADTATPVLSPVEVQIDRSKGYPDASIRLEKVTACPEPTDGPLTLVNRDPATAGWALEIRGQFRIDWQDGTTTTARSITLNSGPEG